MSTNTPLRRAPHAFLVAGLVAVVALFGCSDAGNAPLAGPQASQVPATAGPQEIDIGQAIAAKRRHEAALFSIPGVVGVGVGVDGQGRPEIRVFTLRRDVAGVPQRLDGVPAAIRVTGMFVADGTTDRTRPAPNGYSVGHPQITAGTLGGIVKKTANEVTRFFILSNNHVLAASNEASIGDPALQPGPFDGGSDPADAIAALSDFQVIRFDGSDNQMDAAIAEVFSTSDVTAKTPAAPAGYGAPGTTVVTASVGLQVQKYGRTTQLTKGEVTEIAVTANVCYACGDFFCFTCAKLARFTDQVAFTDISEGGDSGSWIVTDDGNRNPVGLLFAGSATRTLGNRMDLVMNRFGVQVEDGSGLADGDGGGGGGGDGDGGTNSPPTASFTFDCSDLGCDFDGTGSSDADGTIVSYDWEFGDGNTGSGATVTHTYSAGGSYDATLTVTDDGALTDGATQTITVSEPPSGEPTLTATGRKEKGQHVIDLSWTNVPWPKVYVFRSVDLDIQVVAVLDGTASGGGGYSDATGGRGKGSYTHFICEGTGLFDTCSNWVTTSY